MKSVDTQMKSAFFAAIGNVEYAIPFKFRKLMAEYSHNRVLKLIDRKRNIYVNDATR